MESADALFIRLALSRGWISEERHDALLARVLEFRQRGLAKTAEDVLRESGDLDDAQLRVLRRLLSQFTRQARIGDYIVLRRIGVGGTGMVFETRHRRLGRHAAVKVLFPRLEKAKGMAERFLREAKILARVNHPNVVHAYDAGKDGDFYYIAMEMVDGETLAQRLQRHGRLDLDSALDIFLSVARGLEAIHARGLLHRDVKLSNILIDSGDGSVKLVDLGLSFAAREQRAVFGGLVFGTPRYMSPEQVTGASAVDARADLYALGVSLYETLTGRAPFDGTSANAIVRAQVETEPVAPRAIRPGIPAELDAFILKLLEKDPEARPRSASEVVGFLEGLRLERGSVSRTPGDVRRRARWPLVWACVVVLVVAAVLGLLAILPLPADKTALPNSSGNLPGVDPQASSQILVDLDATAANDDGATSGPGEAEVREQLSVALGEISASLDRFWDGGVRALDDILPSRAAVRELLGVDADGSDDLANSAVSGSLERSPESGPGIEESEAAAVRRYRERRFDYLMRVQRLFHVPVELVPRGDGFAVRLSYDFETPAQIRDFRFHHEHWRWSPGALVPTLRGTNDRVDTVALVRLPCRVDGTWAVDASKKRRGRFVVTVGDLSVGFGAADEVIRVFGRDSSDAHQFKKGKPTSVGGRFVIEIDVDRVRASSGDDLSIDIALELPLVDWGRVELRSDPGFRLEQLTVTAELDPVWSEARLEWLEKNDGKQ